jgi:hypothetical protein
MAYDPVGLINTSIAAVVAAATALVLWAIIAPATPDAARGRFVRAARQALARIAAPRLRIGLAEFDTAMTEALDQLKSGLRPDQPDDITAFEAAIALFGAGRELIRVREGRTSSATAALELDLAELPGNRRAQWLDRARRTAQEAAAKCLAKLPRTRSAPSKRIPPFETSSSAASRCSLVKNRRERNPMLREIGVFGAGVPSLLFYFLAAILLFLVIDRLASPLGLYRLVWHPPLVRLALFVCLFSGLVLLTRP